MTKFSPPARSTRFSSRRISIYRSQRNLMILLGFCVFAVVTVSGFVSAYFSFAASNRSSPSEKFSLKSFVEDAIQVALRGNTSVNSGVLSALSNTKRPDDVELFIFTNDHFLIFSSRVELDVGFNMATWLVDRNMTLARKVDEIPPGGSIQFLSRLQPARGWRPADGFIFIKFLPGTSHYVLAFQPQDAQSDSLLSKAWELRTPAQLSLLLGILSGVIVIALGYSRLNFLNRSFQASLQQIPRELSLAVRGKRRIDRGLSDFVEVGDLLSQMDGLDAALQDAWKREESVSASEASARKVVNSLNENIFVLNESNEILWANQFSEQFLGTPRDLLIGSSLVLFTAEQGTEKNLLSGLKAAWQGNAGDFLWSCRNATTGQTFPVQVWASKIALESQEAICVSLRDISSQRKTEVELRRTVQDLETAVERSENVLRTEQVFLARVSHEIRAPLNAIIGLCQIGDVGEKNEQEDQEPQDALRRVESTARYLLRVVDDLLDWAKLEAGKLSINNQPIELSKLMHEVKRFCKVRASGRPLHFNFTISQELPKFIMGDAGRIKQVLINFCENAIKFSHAGVIAVEASLKEEQAKTLCFSVSDLGIGIPASKQHLLFKEFSQADPSIGRHFGGTGLGLSICKMLVDAMKGKIGLKSEEGHGSTFWFEIPLLEVDPLALEQSNQKKIDAVPPELYAAKVLLADDEDINRQLITKVLESAGCKVCSCEDGVVAFEKVLDKDFDFAIFDLEMPEMDGFRTLKSIRRLPGEKGQLPAFAISSHLAENVLEQVKQVGFSGFLTKPIEPSNIYEMLRKAMESGDLRLSKRGNITQPAEIVVQSGLNRLGGDMDLYQTMLERFCSKWLINIEENLKVLRAGGSDAIMLAHKLRGAAATIGADPVAATAAEIEKSLRAGVMPADIIEGLPKMLAALESSIDEMHPPGSTGVGSGKDERISQHPASQKLRNLHHE